MPRPTIIAGDDTVNPPLVRELAAAGLVTVSRQGYITVVTANGGGG